MMRTFEKKVMLFAASIVLALSIYAQPIAQNPKYGKDSVTRVECAKNLSLANSFVKQDAYKDAAGPWRWTFVNCPQASKNIYLDGVKIMSSLAEKATDPKIAYAYIDTMLMVYDQRIVYFQEECRVLGRKGLDMLKYRKDDIDGIYTTLKKSYDGCGQQTEIPVMVTYMQVVSQMYKMKKLQTADVINSFLSISNTLNTNKASAKNPEQIDKAQESIEKIFAESGAANKEELVKLFEPQFNSNPKDIELLKKIIKFLGSAPEGESTDLYAKATENLVSLEPSATAYYAVAKLFYKREDFTKTISFYEKAIELQTDANEKANLLFEQGAITLAKFDNLPKVRTLALAALDLRPNWGKPYILIGQAYANSGKSCYNKDNIDGSAVFWLAVDMFVKAKSVDATVEEEANNLIGTYSKHYPNKEEAFFHGINAGSSYRVGCWINQNTTARF